MSLGQLWLSFSDAHLSSSCHLRGGGGGGGVGGAS